MGINNERSFSDYAYLDGTEYDIYQGKDGYPTFNSIGEYHIGGESRYFKAKKIEIFGAKIWIIKKSKERSHILNINLRNL